MDVIVGGGVVGLSVAWRLAREGRPVTVIDPAPGSGASHAAAGMLAPVSEVTYTEAPLLRLGVASLRRWPAFAAELAADAGLGTTGLEAGGQESPEHAVGLRLAPGAPPGRGLDLRADGTLDVAFGADDLAALEELAAFMDKLGLPVERLTGRECRRLEPMLAPSVRGGLLAPDDAWVNPRRVTAALLTALERRGVPLVRARATGLLHEDGAVVGVRLEPGGEVRGERVVLAAGAWSGGLADVPVRPVKGQIMRLRSPQPLLSRCVRGAVHGSSVYLVPRGDGELVVGATQEEMGFDTKVTAGGLYELLRDARELVPGVTELEVADVVAGLRPGTPDNLPVIGPSGTPGLVYATGHHRGGVLLAPLTTAILLGEESELAALCAPGRFRDLS
ncbi:glycine oxidase ThiO [Nonomuraea aridisoli]|uniref:Glycine oxidase ThiO n=1 Tax=Nonomuraea aridisoli TaxID=2070368 RepID=A0A2W2F9F0_9ACTN|nr:FAD-dependent oxidoreductase [Nonomuraea aridisoli]PZG21528.1 glycine oxidase ThiO [Nonomuraea aridisoli]